MGFLNGLKSLFTGQKGGSGDDAIWLYVQCDRCGEKLRIRIDKQHDLSRDWEAGGYTLRKEIMDSRCFQLMYADVRFDDQFNIISQELSNGHFITPEEYAAGGTET